MVWFNRIFDHGCIPHYHNCSYRMANKIQVNVQAYHNSRTVKGVKISLLRSLCISLLLCAQMIITYILGNGMIHYDSFFILFKCLLLEIQKGIQVNLCQKLFFLQNMGRTCCVQKMFWMSETISVHMFSPGLRLEFSCIKLVIQWTIYRHIVG